MTYKKRISLQDPCFSEAIPSARPGKEGSLQPLELRTLYESLEFYIAHVKRQTGDNPVFAINVKYLCKVFDICK